MIKIDYTKGEEYIPSDVLTADKLITDEPGKLGAVVVLTDGTNNASLTVYDNRYAEISGEILAKGTIPAADRIKNILPVRVPYRQGIYCDVSGTGASYVIYYRNENLGDRARAASFTRDIVFERTESLKIGQEIKSACFDALNDKKLSIFVLASAPGSLELKQSVDGKEWSDMVVSWEVIDSKLFFKEIPLGIRYLQLHYRNGDLPAKIFRIQALASQ